MNKNVIVVGGGIAGLAASIYLARGGCTVTIFEKRRYLGGRAITHLRRGFRFNLGPHAFYRGGPGDSVLRELGVPVIGKRPKGNGIALVGDHQYRLPAGFLSLLGTNLLGFKAKSELGKLMLRIRRIDPKPFAAMTIRQWIDANVHDARVRQVVETFVRLATYSADFDKQSAAPALAQLRLLIRRGVTYVDEGWQKIVDALHSNAVSAGVNFVTSSRIVGLEHDGAVKAVELGGLDDDELNNDTISVAIPEIPPEGTKGTRLPATTVLLAIDPAGARELVPTLPIPSLTPVTLSSLDIALSRLPQPKMTFAVTLDRPFYFSDHARWAQLTPKGGSLLHVAKYGFAREHELEEFVDMLQPGWRDAVVHRRFLPTMTVSNALVTPNAARPGITTPVQGLYVAGDWVGEEGILSDAALASARAAAKAILGTP